MQKVCVCVCLRQLFFIIAIYIFWDMERIWKDGAICYNIRYVIYERLRAECNKQRKSKFFFQKRNIQRESESEAYGKQ